MQQDELLALIRESFLKENEKAELERLCSTADEATVLRELENRLEADIASRGERFARAYDGLETSFRAMDADFDAGKKRLEEETEAKLNALADDDFEARERVWERYDKELELLERTREETLRAAATTAFMS